MKPRGRWQGVLAIVRFNWAFYLVAVVVMIGAGIGAVAASAMVVKFACSLALAGTVWFVFGSLGVSHWIYDRSDLYRWKWLGRALGGREETAWLACHSGFDEVSPALTGLLGNEGMVLDHFDETRMTEPSIHRARKLYPPLPGTIACPYDRWPVEDVSCKVVFGLLAIHELRSEDERAAWFAEAKRCLAPGGRVVIAEHARDLANFIAFGPGFVHFHSPSSWRRCWERAGLHAIDEFRITPWIRIFVLT
jgi:SAM-dependent methyltransferase